MAVGLSCIIRPRESDAYVYRYIHCDLDANGNWHNNHYDGNAYLDTNRHRDRQHYA